MQRSPDLNDCGDGKKRRRGRGKIRGKMHRCVPYNFVYGAQNYFTPVSFPKQPGGRESGCGLNGLLKFELIRLRA